MGPLTTLYRARRHMWGAAQRGDPLSGLEYMAITAGSAFLYSSVIIYTAILALAYGGIEIPQWGVVPCIILVPVLATLVVCDVAAYVSAAGARPQEGE